MQEMKYASIDSQLGNAPCLCEDTEEMFWLRESDDYESRVKLGNLLSGQYRFREAIQAYHSAEIIRADDPMLYVRLGGAYLTLRHFDKAKNAYENSRSLGGNEKTIAYPMGVWHYLQRDYEVAADNFAKVLPCGDEMGIAILYWNSLCCMRGNLPDKLIGTYRDDMSVGHHTAYQSAVEVILGKRTADEALDQAEQDKNDLNAVVTMYGIAVYLEICRKNRRGKKRKRVAAQTGIGLAMHPLSCGMERHEENRVNLKKQLTPYDCSAFTRHCPWVSSSPQAKSLGLSIVKRLQRNAL